MTYTLSVILSITTNQSVLLWLLLSKTKIFPLGNIVMLLFLIRNALGYCDRSVPPWCSDLGTKKLVYPKVLTSMVSVFLSVLTEYDKLYFDSLGQESVTQE